MARNRRQTATDDAQAAQDALLETSPAAGEVSTTTQEAPLETQADAEQPDSQKPSENAPAPNIRLSAMAEPVTEGALGFKGIVLPDAEQQRRGWYEPKAKYILQMYGGTYKILRGKGGNK